MKINSIQVADLGIILLSKMAMRAPNAVPICKIDICGEEEREKIPTFENWKEFSLSHIYERCTALHPTKKKKPIFNFRRQPEDYYYTHNVDEVL